jgi:uncharacterized membrane protein
MVLIIIEIHNHLSNKFSNDYYKRPKEPIAKKPLFTIDAEGKKALKKGLIATIILLVVFIIASHIFTYFFLQAFPNDEYRQWIN